jgi:hypothetical protein
MASRLSESTEVFETIDAGSLLDMTINDSDWRTIVFLGADLTDEDADHHTGEWLSITRRHDESPEVHKGSLADDSFDEFFNSIWSKEDEEFYQGD